MLKPTGEPKLRKRVPGKETETTPSQPPSAPLRVLTLVQTPPHLLLPHSCPHRVGQQACAGLASPITVGVSGSGETTRHLPVGDAPARWPAKGSRPGLGWQEPTGTRVGQQVSLPWSPAEVLPLPESRWQYSCSPAHTHKLSQALLWKDRAGQTSTGPSA